MASRTRVGTAILTAAIMPVTLGTAGCESAGKWGNAAIGAIAGAAAGAGAASAAGGDSESVLTGAIAGAIVGFGVGYVVGDILEKRQASEAEKQRAKELYEQSVDEGIAQAAQQATTQPAQTPDTAPDAPPTTPTTPTDPTTPANVPEEAREEAREEAKETIDTLINEGAEKTGSDKPGRVAIEVERTEEESTFVLVDPLTGEPEETAYTISAEEAERFRNPDNELAQIDGYTVLVAGVGNKAGGTDTTGTSGGA